MKDGFIRVAAACPDISVGDVEHNLAACVAEARRYAALGARVIAFPELSLTGATCGDMFFGAGLIGAAEAALGRFVKETAELDAVIFIGAPIRLDGALYDCAAAVFKGEIKGLIPRAEGSRHFSAAESEETFETVYGGARVTFGRCQVFCADVTDDGAAYDGARIAVAVGADSAAAESHLNHAVHELGANVIVTLASEPAAVGAPSMRADAVAQEARRYRAVSVFANSGEGESGSECIYSGFSVIADALGNIECREPFSDSELTAVADVGALAAVRRREFRRSTRGAEHGTVCRIALGVGECDVPRLSRTPFVPEDAEECRRTCEQAFEIQARGLAGRIKRSYSKTAVLGISGGLDSTLALLVMARATDILGLKRESISAVTMPCFGTTKRTKGNAERLAELLGANVRCIDIKDAVSKHFEDIGHAADNYNVVYENAQARERTQVLMDIANAEGGLVVGTGDLSEAALGWATYNGDHMSMYGVNASVPKTLVRAIVGNYAQTCADADIAAVLNDILATPVSPELLPPKDGEIAQCTEGIVGPYELHDFFIYHFVREGTSPEKLLRMALAAFDGVYSHDTVKGWCNVFLRRFTTQQFKRSCTPDAPSVGIVSLSPRGAWQMPSDYSAAAMTVGDK